VGCSLSSRPQQFFQLYVYFVSVVCIVGSDAVFAVYPHDERPGETTGTGHDLEESVQRLGLGVFSDCVKAERQEEVSNG